MTNAINWFEIYVEDFERAKKFYATILTQDLHMMDTGTPDTLMAGLPYDPASGGVGGALVKSNMRKPSTEGALIYLNGGDDLTAILDRVEGAGGKVVLPKTGIGENGFMAIFADTEGNSIGLHSMG